MKARDTILSVVLASSFAAACSGTTPVSTRSPSPSIPAPTTPTWSPPPPTITVPSLLGETLTQAKRDLAAVELTVKVVHRASTEKTGTVIGEEPPAGSEVDAGTRVEITLASPYKLPDLAGDTLHSVKHLLSSEHLKIKVIYEVSSKKPGTVLAQSPAAGTVAHKGDHITVTVAKAAPTPPPPCQAVNNNPWGFCFQVGSYIHNPPSDFCSYFNCIDSFWDGRGYVEECSDMTYSKSGGIQGSCSYHGGNYRALLDPSGRYA